MNRQEEAEYPCRERYNHAHKPAHESEQHGEHNNADNDEIERCHFVFVTIARSCPANLSLATAASAAARVANGPTRTRCTEPCAVGTASIYVAKPLDFNVATSS